MSIKRDEAGEEESFWVPLVPKEQFHVEVEPTVEVLNGKLPRTAYSFQRERNTRDYDHNSNLSQSDSIRTKEVCNSNIASSRLRKIEKNLDDRISIQTHLVDCPLNYFWQRFLINLLRQLWALEIRKRVGIILLTAGLFTRIFIWSTSFLFYPRYAIISLIILASLFYLDPLDINDQVRTTWDTISFLFGSSSYNSTQVPIDAIKIRNISLTLLLISSFLEIRTFMFLSRISEELAVTDAAGVEENGWTMLLLYRYNFGVAVCILFLMFHLRRVRHVRSCHVSYYGLFILYGFSLFITILSYDSNTKNVRQILILGAPFLSATATLLLAYENNGCEWLSRIARLTFCLSLRDVFSSVSEHVTDDDMLQLAIFRWICAFWASNPASRAPENKGGRNSSATGKCSLQSQSTTKQNLLSEAKLNCSHENRNETISFKHNSVRWEELQSMLSVEIDKMKTEIYSLKNERSQRRDSKSSFQNVSHPPKVMTPVKKESYTTQLLGLKSILLSFNKDDRAQLAVTRYRRAVESIPPKKNTAVVISILWRCPAFATMILNLLLLSELNSLFLSSLILSPFLVMEYYRIVEWIEACEQISSKSNRKIDEEHTLNDWRIPRSLKNVDTMTILLAGDFETIFHPPPLLKVWFNIMSSVSALEVGLTTARCVETTVIALEFAGSAMSLVKFGSEIYENGIFHGALIFAKEILSIYDSKRDFSDNHSAQYTGAVINAFRNGHKVVGNINALSEDKNVVSIFRPFLRFLAMLSNGKRLGEAKKENSVGSSSTTHSNNGVDSDEVDIHVEKKENLDIATVKRNIVDSNCEEDKVQPTPRLSEGQNTSLKPRNFLLPAHVDSLSKLPGHDEDISQVMEMIVITYESALIDMKEKDNFFKQLSKLRKDESYDPSILFAIKRTLKIILENGTMVDAIDNAHLLDDVDQQSQGSNRKMSRKYGKHSSLDTSLFHNKSTGTSGIDQFNPSQSEEKISANPKEKVSEGSQLNERNADMLNFCAAALGIVASGLGMTMGGNDKQSRSKQYSVANIEYKMIKERNKERESAAVEIVDVADHIKEDDWITLVH